MKVLKKTHGVESTQNDQERELAYAIAQEVFTLRTQQGLSQGGLAEKAGTKQPRISVVESANGIPSLGLLLRIAQALGVRLVVKFEKPGETE
jgi:transcriptional regulator with XRE-family HTH domain